jgi:hypothetical protein
MIQDAQDCMEKWCKEGAQLCPACPTLSRERLHQFGSKTEKDQMWRGAGDGPAFHSGSEKPAGAFSKHPSLPQNEQAYNHGCIETIITNQVQVCF